MNQPNELAEQIRQELEKSSFKSLIARFRNIQYTRNNTQTENLKLLRNASQLASQLQIETEKCQQELSTERLVTSELHKLLADKRKTNNDALHELESEQSQLRDQLIANRDEKSARLQILDELIAEYSRLKESGGFSEEQKKLVNSAALLKKIPFNPQTTNQMSIEERWQGIGLLIAATERPYVPLMQEFPELAKTLQ